VSLETAPRRVSVTGDLFHGVVPDGAVYVGRPAPGLPGSEWANPHRVGGTCRRCGVEHDQASAVAAYAVDLAAQPDRIAQAVEQLRGRDLACWCKDVPCHVDALLPAANPPIPSSPSDAHLICPGDYPPDPTSRR